ncbi:threonyl-tRNA synthetase editing domain-containing protein [Nocardia sp. KC 131]|uniref:threonyl-tRNA synthetase editing domain-containing protein n=1 Tax=Nocardia arseniciresistens TaxID=3392119 RepID=UPI00398E4901
MLIFSLQCRTFEFVVKSPTPVAVELDPEKINLPVSYDNCLFLLVAVEAEDTTKQVARAAKALGKAVRNTGVKQLVINGFAGLSKLPADSTHSQTILSGLHSRLIEREPGLHVDTMPFGWRKEWTLDVVSGVWAQRCIHV